MTYEELIAILTGMTQDDLHTLLNRAMMDSQGQSRERQRPRMSDGIDRKTGLDVYTLCPNPGDVIVITNCGTHYEVRYHEYDPELHLTAEEIELICTGEMIWH